jgi:hypothetical protein
MLTTLGDASVAEPVSFEVVCRIEDGELRVGDLLRLELPRSWHAGEKNAAKRVQASDPAGPNYVTASTSDPGVRVTCAVEEESADEYVKSSRVGLDNRRHRYAFVVRVEIRAGTLRRGSAIDVVFGAGPQRFIAPFHPEGDELVRAVAQVGETTAPVPDDRCARIHVSAGPCAELVVVLPSFASPGATADIRIVSLDRFGNRTSAPGNVRVVGIDGPARLANDVEPGGYTRLRIIATGEGVARVHVQGEGQTAVTSNPILVRGGDRAGLYWGDLHSHASRSFDGVGMAPFEYARDVACLDFYALTEHAELWGDETWEWLRSAVTSYERPGEFVTFLAYEATFGAPWGHHNVYFRHLDGPVISRLNGTLEDLWAALTIGQAVTVPHHTGVCFLRPQAGASPRRIPATVDWSHHQPALRPLVEIYSAHGQSELFDPDHPLAYEHSDFQFNSSAEGPHYAQDAWRLGHRLGVIASSDDHHGQPGRGERGLAAIHAGRLTRDGIFDALVARSCYATTGARIIVEFEAAGVSMGGHIGAHDAVPFTLRVHGTGPLEFVEIVRLTPTAPEAVIARWEPQSADLLASAIDDQPPSNCLYYLRLRQREGYRGRPPAAWTSPIWVQD